jgi:hypothetical protein
MRMLRSSRRRDSTTPSRRCRHPGPRPPVRR